MSDDSAHWRDELEQRESTALADDDGGAIGSEPDFASLAAPPQRQPRSRLLTSQESASSSSTGAGAAHGTRAASDTGAQGGNTSLEVFLRHVRGNANDDDDDDDIAVDASQVLSRACFEEWVATRRGSLKSAEESFRRSLTSHVTGLDGRKAFPPRVEVAILLELRQQRVWPCFESALREGKRVNIGLQGFRTLGFHEQAAAQTRTAASSSSSNSRARATRPLHETKTEPEEPAESAARRKRRRKREKAALATQRDASPGPAPMMLLPAPPLLLPPPQAADAFLPHLFHRPGRPHGDVRALWMRSQPVLRLILSTFSVSPTEFAQPADQHQQRGRQQQQQQQQQVLPPLALLTSSATPLTLRAHIVRALVRHVPPHFFSCHYGSLLALAPGMLASDDLASLAAPAPLVDVRVSERFMCPTAAERRFVAGLPVGQCEVCAFTLVCTGADDWARQLAAGELAGAHASGALRPAAFWLLVAAAAPALFGTAEEVWLRTRVPCADGRARLFLARVAWRGHCVAVAFQDVSGMHADIMSLPPLEHVLEQHHAAAGHPR